MTGREVKEELGSTLERLVSIIKGYEVGEVVGRENGADVSTIQGTKG